MPKSLGGGPGALRGDQGRSEALPGGVQRGFGARSGPPKALPERPEGSRIDPKTPSGCLRTTFSSDLFAERFAGGSRSDFFRILGRPREFRGLSHCTGAVFREGRPFFVGAARRPPNRAKSDPRTTPGRLQMEAERSKKRPGERSRGGSPGGVPRRPPGGVITQPETPRTPRRPGGRHSELERGFRVLKL